MFFIVLYKSLGCSVLSNCSSVSPDTKNAYFIQLYYVCTLEKDNERKIKVLYILKIHKEEEYIKERHADIQVRFSMVLILSADASKTFRTFCHRKLCFCSTEFTVIALFGTAFINSCGFYRYKTIYILIYKNYKTIYI